MYRSAISSRLSLGRSTPAIRAMSEAPSYPCRCLCRGLEQITRIRPRRRTTRQRSLILFTDGLTFMTCLSSVSVHHTTSGQVVRRQLYPYPVAGKDPDVVHPHLPRDVGEHLVPVLQLHPEHGIGEGLHDRPLDLDRIVFGHAPADPLCRDPSRGRAERASEGQEPSIRPGQAMRPRATRFTTDPTDRGDRDGSAHSRAVRTSCPSWVTATVCSKC